MGLLSSIVGQTGDVIADVTVLAFVRVAVTHHQTTDTSLKQMLNAEYLLAALSIWE